MNGGRLSLHSTNVITYRSFRNLARGVLILLTSVPCATRESRSAKITSRARARISNGGVSVSRETNFSKLDLRHLQSERRVSKCTKRNRAHASPRREVKNRRAAIHCRERKKERRRAFSLFLTRSNGKRSSARKRFTTIEREIDLRSRIQVSTVSSEKNGTNRESLSRRYC